VLDAARARITAALETLVGLIHRVDRACSASTAAAYPATTPHMSVQEFRGARQALGRRARYQAAGPVPGAQVHAAFRHAIRVRCWSRPRPGSTSTSAANLPGGQLRRRAPAAGWPDRRRAVGECLRALAWHARAAWLCNRRLPTVSGVKLATWFPSGL